MNYSYQRNITSLMKYSGCRTTAGNSCFFPFQYENIKYYECDKVRNNGVFWCAVNVTLNGHVDVWGDCDIDLCHMYIRNTPG